MHTLKYLLSSLLTTALLAISPAIQAENLPDSCKEIKKGDKDACAQEAKKACAAIEDYWTKVKCEGGLAVKHSACVSGGYLKACQQPERDYWEVCRKAHELDMNKPESIDAWKRRLVEYEKRVKQDHKAFHDAWKVCFGTAKGCQVSAHWLDACEQAGGVFKKTYTEAVDFFLETGLANTQQNIKRALKSKDFRGASSYAESLSQRIMVFHDLNKELESVRYKSDELDKALASVKASHKKAKKGYAKALAGRVCPPGKNPDAGLSKVLRPGVDGFFHDFGDTKVKVKVFRLNGTKKTESIAQQKLTKESVPAIVCTEKKTPIETYCQSFNVTIRRQKFKDHPWEDWKVFVGGGERMLCKKVR